MMVCNSKLCKNSMYYAPLYAAICNYSKRLHLSHVNPFLKLKLFLQKYFGSSKFRTVHREKNKEVFFLQEWYQFKKCAARIKAMLRKPAKDGFIMQAFSGQRFHI